MLRVHLGLQKICRACGVHGVHKLIVCIWLRGFLQLIAITRALNERILENHDTHTHSHTLTHTHTKTTVRKSRLNWASRYSHGSAAEAEAGSYSGYKKQTYYMHHMYSCKCYTTVYVYIYIHTYMRVHSRYVDLFVSIHCIILLIHLSAVLH